MINEPTAVIYADPDNFLDCKVSIIMLFTDVQENTIYTWTTDDGRTSNGGNIMVDHGGMVILTVLDTITGCSNINSLMIQDQEEYPFVLIDNPNPVTCQEQLITIDASRSQTGENIVHQWYNENFEAIEGANSLKLEVDYGGEFILESMDTINGCVNLDTVAVQVDVNYADVEAGEDQTIDCVENIASLNGSFESTENTAFSWFTLDGNIRSGANTLTPVVDAEGWYFLEVTNLQSGCISIDSVQVMPLPDVLSDVDVELFRPTCFGDSNGSITIKSFEGGTPPYLISLNGSDFSENKSFNELRPGNYNIVIKDANGCQLSKTINIEAGNLISVDVEVDNDYVKLGESIELSGNTSLPDDQIGSILWTPEEIIECPSCLTTIATPTESTRFILTIIDINGCEGDAQLEVRVDRRVDIFVPNIFTPNGDGENDFFTIYTSDIDNVREVKKLLIYDRWGELVARIENFQPNVPELGWDGTFRNSRVNPGVFAYLVEVELFDGTITKKAGDVTLLK
jgi:gliding motility-associated-like protein